MSAEKRDFDQASLPPDAPPPYSLVEENGHRQDRMASTDYYQSHPAAQSVQHFSPPPPQQQPSFPPPPQQNSYPPPPQQSNSYPPPPNGYQSGPPQGQGAPHQGYASPVPQQQSYQQASHYATPPPPGQIQPSVQNGWNPTWGRHPHAKPYQSPTPGQQGPNIVHAQQLPGSYPTPQPNYAYQQQGGPPPAQGPYPPPLQQSTYPPPPRQPQGQMQPQGNLAVPAMPPRRYSEPPDDRKQRHDRRDGRYDDRYDDRDDKKHRKGKSKDHSNRNTFLGAGGGALIGDAIFPGLGTVGGLLLGGLAGHNHGRSKSSVGRRDGSGGRRSYEEEYEEGKRRRHDRDRERDRY